jgi:hypothetical protein
MGREKQVVDSSMRRLSRHSELTKLCKRGTPSTKLRESTDKQNRGCVLPYTRFFLSCVQFNKIFVFSLFSNARAALGSSNFDLHALCDSPSSRAQNRAENS